MADQIGNMRRVTHDQLGDLIKKFYKVKKSLMIWGTIGIGKSDKIRDTCKELAEENKLELSDGILDTSKFSYMDVRLATCGAEDVKGIPFPFKICSKCNNHLGMNDVKCPKCNNTNLVVTTVWLLADWFPRDPKSKGTLLFDEITNATPIVQHASYTIIRDRRIGNVKLPDGWLVVSAGNRVEDMSNVFEMSKALENRFGHVELITPTVKDWKEWALTHGIDKSIIAFLLWRPDRLMMPKGSTSMKS
jgi:MoxR-like ATPase